MVADLSTDHSMLPTKKRISWPNTGTCSSTCDATCCLHAVGLTDKEAVVFLTRLAALDNALTPGGTDREQWQRNFLELLYTMCTTVMPSHVSPTAMCSHVSSSVMPFHVSTTMHGLA